MQYPRALAFVLVMAAACGDNRAVTAPDGPPPDGGGGEVCRLDSSVAGLAGGAWDPRFTIPGFTGHDGAAPVVYDFARDTDGSIVAAGKFTYVGREPVAPLMRWRAGAWTPARTTWELTPPGAGFSAIAISPTGALALATNDDFGARDGEIWLDDGSGLRVIGSYLGQIRSLAWYRGALWAVGWVEFGSGADVVRGLAVWDGTAWTAAPGGAANGFTHELTVDGDDLLVGGYFTEIGGITARGAARWNGTAWTSLGFPTEVGVYALGRGPDGELYAGGALGNLGGAATGGIARWSGTAWEPVAGGLGNRDFPGAVTDLVAHDGSLYVTGCFHTAGGADGAPGAIVTPDVARFDGAWHGLDDPNAAVFAPWLESFVCGDEGPSAIWDTSKQRMISAGDRLLLGGSFPGIAGVISQSLIGYDGTTWQAQGDTSGLGIGGSIDRIGVAGESCEVWGLGTISHAAGTPTRARVVRFDGTAWTPISDAIPRDASCNGFAVSPSGGAAVGCIEFPLGGGVVGRVYRSSGDRLVQVGGDTALVQALAYGADGRLWIGGTTEAGAGFVARLDGETITMIEQGFDGPVTQLDPGTGDDLIAGGQFTKIGALDAARIARWDGTAWRALGAGMPGMVTAIAHDATTVYASTYDEGAGAYLLGAFDGTAWTELAVPAAGLTPHRFFNFNAIRVIDGGVVAGGSVVLDDESGRGAVIYAGGQFRALGGGGVNAVNISDLAVSRDAIWLAGWIAEGAARGGATTSSVGVARYATSP